MVCLLSSSVVLFVCLFVVCLLGQARIGIPQGWCSKGFLYAVGLSQHFQKRCHVIKVMKENLFKKRRIRQDVLNHGNVPKVVLVVGCCLLLLLQTKIRGRSYRIVEFPPNGVARCVLGTVFVLLPTRGGKGIVGRRMDATHTRCTRQQTTAQTTFWMVPAAQLGQIRYGTRQTRGTGIRTIASVVPIDRYQHNVLVAIAIVVVLLQLPFSSSS